MAACSLYSAQSVPEQRIVSHDQLSCRELARRGREEIRQFMCGMPTESPACFELFRRALVLRDEEAWVSLYDLYSTLIGSWILHTVAAGRLPSEEYASMINETFARFYRGVSPDKFASFHSVKALLSYLKCCTRSVVLDEVRARLPYMRHEMSLDDLEVEPMLADPAEDVISTLCSTQLWQQVMVFVRSEQERVLLQELAHGARPQEIHAHHRRMFTTVDEVYRVQRNLRGRLMRHRQDWERFC
jgi:hypothetical protein